MYMNLANPHTSQFFEPINILFDNQVELRSLLTSEKNGLREFSLFL